LKKNNRRWANQLCSTVYRGGFYWSTSTAAISLIILLNHQGKLATRCASDNHISAADRLISQFVFIQPAGDFFSLSLSLCVRTAANHGRSKGTCVKATGGVNQNPNRYLFPDNEIKSS
jgi:hypothetical protein